MKNIIKKLGTLSNCLSLSNLNRESLLISNIMKKAYVNEARIILKERKESILGELYGTYRTGHQDIFGQCEALKFNDAEIFGDKRTVWEIHKSIEGEEYEGLGYMNDLMTAVINQVQNNGGVVFSGISSEAWGSLVTDQARKHNLKRLGSKFSVNPILIFSNENDHWIIFNGSNLEQAANEVFKILSKYAEFEKDHSLKLILEKLNILIKNPYTVLSFDELYPDVYVPNVISCSLQITSNSSTASIPVSIEFPSVESETENLKESRKQELEIEALKEEYNKLYIVYDEKIKKTNKVKDEIVKVLSPIFAYNAYRYINIPFNEDWISNRISELNKEKDSIGLIRFNDNLPRIEELFKTLEALEELEITPISSKIDEIRQEIKRKSEEIENIEDSEREIIKEERERRKELVGKTRGIYEKEKNKS